MVAGARAERAKGPKGNAIGLNGTVNLPTCDLQAAKVAAKSGPRPSADVPQLFLAIFRSFLLCDPCICLGSFLSFLQVLDGIFPLRHSTLSAQRPTTTLPEGTPGLDPEAIGLAGRLSSGRSNCRAWNHVSPTSSFGHDGQWMSSRLGFT